MIKFRFFLPDFEIVPKPARMSHARRNLQSNPARKYLENQEALATYMMLKHKGDPIPGPLSLSFVYRTRSNRRFDRTNIEKAVEDALVKARVIEDDNVKVLPDSHQIIVRGGQVGYWLGLELRTTDPDKRTKLDKS